MTKEEMEKRYGKGAYLADPMTGSPIGKLASVLRRVSLGEPHAAPGSTPAPDQPDALDAIEDTVQAAPASSDPQSPITNHQSPTDGTKVPAPENQSTIDNPPSTNLGALASAYKAVQNQPTTSEQGLQPRPETPEPSIDNGTKVPTPPRSTSPDVERPPAIDYPPSTNAGTKVPATENPSASHPSPVTNHELPITDQNKAAFAWETSVKPGEENLAYFATEAGKKERAAETKGSSDWMREMPTIEPASSVFLLKDGRPNGTYRSLYGKMLTKLLDTVKDPEVRRVAQMAFDPREAKMIPSIPSLKQVLKHAQEIDARLRGVDTTAVKQDSDQAQNPSVEEANRLLSSTPPPAEETEEVKYKKITPKPYKFPELVPARFRNDTDRKRYEKSIDKLRKQAAKMSDPDIALKAAAVVDSGARLSQVRKTLNILSYHDRIAAANAKQKEKALKRAAQKRKKEEAIAAQKNKLELKATLDHKKITQKYAKEAAAYKNMGTVLGRLIDNYTDDLVGWFDQPVNKIGQVVGIVAPDDSKRGATFNQDLASLVLGEKDAKNMGTAFTVGERAILAKTMPDPYEREDVFKRKFANYVRTMRDIVASKVKGIEDAGYEVGKLHDAAVYLDNQFKRSLKKFGLENDPAFRNDTFALGDAPAGQTTKRKLRVIGSAPQATTPVTPPTSSPTQSATPAPPEPTPVGQKTLPDGRIAVKYSDGSIRYYAKP